MFSDIPVGFPKRDGNSRSRDKAMYNYRSANQIFCATTIVASSENSAEIARNPNVAIRAGYVGIIIAKNITQMPTV